MDEKVKQEVDRIRSLSLTRINWEEYPGRMFYFLFRRAILIVLGMHH